MRYPNLLATALLLVVPGVVHAGPAKKTYEVRFEQPAVKGQITKETYEETTSTVMKITAGKQVVQSMEEKTGWEFEYTTVVMDVKAGDVVKSSLAFTKARHTVDGAQVAYGFEGRTVVMRRDKSGKAHFKYEDGTAVAEEDLEGLERVVSNADGEKDSDADVLAPDGPVAVGEKWLPDIGEVAGAMLGIDDPSVLDTGKSKAVMSLAGVEVKDGVTYGIIKGQITIVTTRLDELVLGKPLVIKVGFAGTLALDAPIPEGEFELGMSMKGKKIPVDMGLGVPSLLTLVASGKVSQTIEAVEPPPGK